MRLASRANNQFFKQVTITKYTFISSQYCFPFCQLHMTITNNDLQFSLVVLQLLWFGSWHAINNAALRHKCECSVRLSGTHFSAGGFWRRSWKISKTQVLVLKFALNYCHTKAAWHNLQCVEEHQNFSNSIYRRSVRKSIENLFYR